MPKYINLQSGDIFTNKNSIPLKNQKILGIKSLRRFTQEFIKIINKPKITKFKYGKAREFEFGMQDSKRSVYWDTGWHNN